MRRFTTPQPLASNGRDQIASPGLLRLRRSVAVGAAGAGQPPPIAVAGLSAPADVSPSATASALSAVTSSQVLTDELAARYLETRSGHLRLLK